MFLFTVARIFQALCRRRKNTLQTSLTYTASHQHSGQLQELSSVQVCTQLVDKGDDSPANAQTLEMPEHEKKNARALENTDWLHASSYQSENMQGKHMLKIRTTGWDQSFRD